MARSPYSHTDRDLLARIARSAGSKAGYKQLVRELGLGGGRERRLLLEQLRSMVARGQLRQLEDELWAIPMSAGDDPGPRRGVGTPIPQMRGTQEHSADRSGRERLHSGRLELHRDGYGFVRMDPGPRAESALSIPSGDIFIPPNALHGAMHGDLVLVDEDPAGRDGRRSGRIARVLTRRNPTVVGIFHYGGSQGRRRTSRSPEYAISGPAGNFVQPFDERLGGPIEIPEGAEFVPPPGASPHRTIGEGVRANSAKMQQEAPQRSHNPAESPQATTSRGDASRPDFNDTPGVPGQSLKLDTEIDLHGRWTLEGLAVEVEITSFPQPGRPATGRVVEVLGPPDAFGVDVEIIIRKHAIPHAFPSHVLAEADERAAVPIAALPENELALHEDFRGLPIVTIDGETARDFDDAVLVRPLPNGNTELQVHIADVSWYVRPASALDTEARVRGTSVYFPDRAVPMLPHALSSGMCSLLPHEDRLVLSCVMEIDQRGEIMGYRVSEGIIRSARRMTYTGVQQCLNASPAASTWNTKTQITPEPTAEDHSERERIGLEQPELPDAFDRMLHLALQLNQKRVRRGSIDFDLPEPVIEFDPDGNMKAIVRSERGWAHRLIEEFMLSANECVATWLTAQRIPSIYRIHEMPDPKRIVEFEETAAGFGQTLGIGALPIKRLTMKTDRREAQRRSGRGRESRASQTHELPDRIPVTPQMYQRLVRRIEGKPEERILAYLMLRSLKQARYSEKNEGHFALASPCYTHFTSPIRRYPDLIVHRLLRTMLRRDASPQGGPILSSDPQPWAADATHSHTPAGSPSGFPANVSAVHRAEKLKPLYFEQGKPPVPASPRTKRGRSKAEGRIGWSAEGEQQASRPESSHRESAPASPDSQRASEPHLLGADPISAEELADIALESSQAERRAADAERELIEWKKMKFMADKIGDDFSAIILSVTKYGFFVELDELFVEGLVPLGSLAGDFYAFRDTDRAICGARNGHCFRIGERVHVTLDRIDRQLRRLQFALTPGTEPVAQPGSNSLRKGKSDTKKARAPTAKAEGSAGSKKGRQRRKG